MAGTFTDEELQAATAAILAPDPGRTRDTQGRRRALSKFETTQHAVVSAFLAEPALLYSAARAARDTALTQVDALLTSFTQMRGLLRATLRFVAPLTDLGPLHAAASAALALDSGNPTQHRLLASSSYAQLRQFTKQHLQRTLPALRSSTSVSPAPAEAREQLAQQWVDAREVLAALQVRLLALSTSRASLSSASLPKAASTQAVQRSRQALTEMVERLDEQTPEQRLNTLRADTLTLVALRAALSSIARLPENGTFYPLEGLVETLLDAAHPGVAASTDPSVAGPHELNELLALTTQLGAGPVRTSYLPLSPAPQLIGTAIESYDEVTALFTSNGPFTIGSGTSELQVFLHKPSGEILDGSLTLTTGVGRTSTQIAAEVQAFWTGLGVGASFTATASGAAIHFQALGGAQLLFGSGTANTPLGLLPTGGFVLHAAAAISLQGSTVGPFAVVAGVNDTLILFARDVAAGALVQVTAVLPAGSQSTAAVNAALQAALDAAGVGGLQYGLFDASGHVAFGSPVGAAYELRIGSGSANALLGFTAGQTSQGKDDNRLLALTLNGVPVALSALAAGTRSARTLAQELAAQLGAAWSVTATGAFGSQRLSFRYKDAGSSVASAVAPVSGLGTYLGLPLGVTTRGSALTSAQLAAALAPSLDVVATAEVVGGATKVRSGPSPTSGLTLYRERGVGAVSSPAPLTLRLAVEGSVLEVGDRLRLDDGSFWLVSAVSSSYVEATGSSTPAARPGAAYDGGPLQLLLAGRRIQVAEGALRGTYTVKSQSNPLQVQVVESPPVSPLAAAPFTGDAVVGSEVLRLIARSFETLTLGGPAADYLFGGSQIAQPSALWVKFTSRVAPRPGDQLQLFLSNYLQPTASYGLVQVSAGLAQLVAGVTHPQSWATQGVVPVARMLNVREQLVAALEGTLASLLSDSPRLDPFDQALRQVLAGGATTPAPRVQAALAASDPLIAWLTSVRGALAAYTVEPSEAWTRLLRLLDQQGSDRAKDLLVSCRFTEFFGLGIEGASYEGQLASTLRAVVRTELPVDRRNQRQGSELRSQVQEDDPDTNFDDGEPAVLGKNPVRGVIPRFEE